MFVKNTSARSFTHTHTYTHIFDNYSHNKLTSCWMNMRDDGDDFNTDLNHNVSLKCNRTFQIKSQK